MEVSGLQVRAFHPELVGIRQNALFTCACSILRRPTDRPGVKARLPRPPPARPRASGGKAAASEELPDPAQSRARGTKVSLRWEWKRTCGVPGGGPQKSRMWGALTALTTLSRRRVSGRHPLAVGAPRAGLPVLTGRVAEGSETPALCLSSAGGGSFAQRQERGDLT